MSTGIAILNVHSAAAVIVQNEIMEFILQILEIG